MVNNWNCGLLSINSCVLLYGTWAFTHGTYLPALVIFRRSTCGVIYGGGLSGYCTPYCRALTARLCCFCRFHNAAPFPGIENCFIFTLSNRNSSAFFSMPSAYPVRLPFVPAARWQGTRYSKARLFPRKVNSKPLFYFFKNGLYTNFTKYLTWNLQSCVIVISV